MFPTRLSFLVPALFLDSSFGTYVNELGSKGDSCRGKEPSSLLIFYWFWQDFSYTLDFIYFLSLGHTHWCSGATWKIQLVSGMELEFFIPNLRSRLLGNLPGPPAWTVQGLGAVPHLLFLWILFSGFLAVGKGGQQIRVHSTAAASEWCPASGSWGGVPGGWALGLLGHNLSACDRNCIRVVRQDTLYADPCTHFSNSNPV